MLVLASAAPQLDALEADLPAGIEEPARLTVVQARLVSQAKVVAAMGRYGFAKSNHCLIGASIAPGESVKMRLTLKAGQGCLWFAEGDDNSQDLDLDVTGPDGVRVAKNTRRDAVPMVQFAARDDGEHCVTLTHFKGTGTSFCALVMMEQDGWAIPFDNLAAAISQFVGSAGRTALFVDQKSGGQLSVRLPAGGSGWCLFGTVMQQNESRSVTNLSLSNGLHVFLAAGCGQATDIDMEVTDQDGNTIVSDTELDATPMGIALTDAKSLYEVSTSLPGSRGAALTLSGVLRVEPAKGAGAVIRPAMARW